MRPGTRADGTPWRIAIERPLAEKREMEAAVPLVDAAMATAGGSRHFFEYEGKRYSHIIDPATGRPVEHTLASVTVAADKCLDADGWDTPLMVLGPERGSEVRGEVWDRGDVYLALRMQRRMRCGRRRRGGSGLGGNENLSADFADGRRCSDVVGLTLTALSLRVAVERLLRGDVGPVGAVDGDAGERCRQVRATAALSMLFLAAGRGGRRGRGGCR